MNNPPGGDSEALPSVADRFTHVVSAIGNVDETLNGISEEELASDRVRRPALERLFAIVSIASSHIPGNLKAAENAVDWQAIADIGDRLENTRNRIETHVLWAMSQGTLMPLKACAAPSRTELNSCHHPEVVSGEPRRMINDGACDHPSRRARTARSSLRMTAAYDASS